MLDDRTTPSIAPEPTGNGAGRPADFSQLRELLVGPEQRRLQILSDRLDALELDPAQLAEHLPAAIALRTRRDQQLGRALAPTIETALRESIRRNPREIATAIFPILGPAIRKAIAETMAGLVRSINSAVENSFSLQGLKWRLEAWRTGVSYPEIVIKHSLVYRVEQIFLIHAETGLLLSHVSAPDLKVPDADLISGMLTAIQDFVRDSFRPAEGGTLRGFSVGDHNVLVEAGPAALIAAVVRGQAPDELLRRLQYTLESIHLEFATPLAEFAGDPAPFEPVRPVLAESLETVLAASPASRRWAWVRWALPVGLVLAIGAAFAIRSSLRWGRAIRALESEPGILVVENSRSWRGGRVRGLKDPLARDPAAVLTAAGVPVRFAGQWEPYLSLDSAMVMARARAVLALPAEVTASFRADTLALAGSAPLSWLAIIRAAGRPPGIAAIDLAAVELRLPAGLDSLRQAVTKTLIRFDPGSAELTGGAGGLVALAESVRRLVADATEAGAAIRIELIGRTDPSGSELVNQDLAQRRIDRIAARLLRTGIPEAVLVRRPLATSRPLPSADPAEGARINRSVAFTVGVTSQAVTRGPP
ncbi:MAG: OmpA family protein [Gemmatimonadales bacterium]